MPTRPIASALASASLLLAFPALAHEGAPPLPELTHGGMVQGLPAQPVEPQFGYSAEERDAWLAECRSRYSDNGLGGALIGGVLGGIAGHEIAGSGDKVLGTVMGATAGAVAGAAIDKAEDAGEADACDDYLARYEAGFRGGHGQHQAYGHGYGYGAPVMWVPVRIKTHRHGAGCGCAKERVVEEWIEEDVIEAPVKTVPIPPPPTTKTVPLKPVK
jgi:hypothetical protein